MKRWKILAVLLAIVAVLWQILEFCAIPAVIIICGLLNHYDMSFYIITIGVYLAVFALIELTMFLIEKIFGKRIDAFIFHKLERTISLFHLHNGGVG